MLAQKSSYIVAPNPGENTSGGELPTGMVVQYAGTTPPAGWLFCDGANYLPSDYVDLFLAIGQNYSAGTTNNGVLGPIEVGASYSFTGTTFTTSAFGPQVNFYINPGCIVTLSGAVAQTGADINGLRIRITSAPQIDATGGTFVGTFLDIPSTPTGTGFSSLGYMDMLRLSFQVPDTTGVTIRGAQGGDSPFNIGERGGNDNIELTANQLPSHAHGIPGAAGEGYVSFSSGGVGYGDNGNVSSVSGSNTRTDGEVYFPDGATATADGNPGIPVPVTNPYVTIASIIKT